MNPVFDFSDLIRVVNELECEHFKCSDPQIKSYLDISGKVYKCNVTEDNVTYLMPIPGLTKDDVKIKIDKDILVITLSKQTDFIKILTKSIKLVEGINKNDVKASVDNGLLKVVFNKSKDNIFNVYVD